MFGNFRKKINSVIQDGITLSENLRSPTSSSSSPVSIEKKFSIPDAVNLCAGNELLEKNEHYWNEIHDMNERNADKAREIDRRILVIRNTSERMSTDVADLNVSLVSLPTVIAALRNCVETIDDIKDKCENLESKLFILEDLFEVLDLQEKQLDHKFEMAMYKEKKLGLYMKLNFNVLGFK